MATKEKVDVRDKVNEWMGDNDRTLGWLASKTGINYHTLYSIFTLKTVKLSDEKLDNINASLNENFTR